MKINDLTRDLNDYLQSRYRIEQNSKILESLKSIAPLELEDWMLFRIQRSYYPKKENSYWKTLLVVGLNNIEQLKHAITWTATVKDLLLNPESSDLYLFLCWKEESQPSIDECLRIEATEEFCRKFVVRPNEDFNSLIDRTFIKNIYNSSQNITGSDPLVSALSDVEKDYPWLNHAEQQKWRDAFNSGISGTELIEELFDIKKVI
jgi:hypothetical protein